MESKTRILIADDQKLFADNLKSVLEFRCPDFEVVGLAKDGQEAVEFVRRDQPDIVLMDIRMPVMDGVQATGVIHREFPAIKILVLTTFDDDESVHDAVRNGALGYMLKNIPFDELLAALRAVRSGMASFSPAVVAKLFQQSEPAPAPPPPAAPPRSEAPPRPEGAAPAWFEGLGRREKDILRLLARGLENKDIAAELFISEQTVKNYVYGLYGKIGEHNRVKVIQLLQKHASLLKI